VLHIADLFGWGLIPVQTVDDPMVSRIHEVLGEVVRYDADVLIPGHGPLLAPAHIRRWLAYFDDLLERVPPLARQGKSPGEMQAAIPVPDDMQDWWRLADWKHARNLEIVARSRPLSWVRGRPARAPRIMLDSRQYSGILRRVSSARRLR
jgi:hypothetical protein